MSLNFMAAVTNHSDFGAHENEVWHYFHFIPIKEGFMMPNSLPTHGRQRDVDTAEWVPESLWRKSSGSFPPEVGLFQKGVDTWCQLQRVPVGPARLSSLWPLGTWALSALLKQVVIDVYDSSWANREHLWKESTFFRLLEGWRISLPLRKWHSPENRLTCQFPHLGASLNLSFPRCH